MTVNTPSAPRGATSHDGIQAGKILTYREAMEGKHDRSFRDEQEHEGHEADTQSDAGKRRQGECDPRSTAPR